MTYYYYWYLLPIRGQWSSCGLYAYVPGDGPRCRYTFQSHLALWFEWALPMITSVSSRCWLSWRFGDVGFRLTSNRKEMLIDYAFHPSHLKYIKHLFTGVSSELSSPNNPHFLITIISQDLSSLNLFILFKMANQVTLLAYLLQAPPSIQVRNVGQSKQSTTMDRMIRTRSMLLVSGRSSI